MIKLLHSPASPYSAKVRMAALYAGIVLDKVTVDAGGGSADLNAQNPLGKIPVLVTETGEAVYDSSVITQYLNRISGNKLFPRNPAKRLESERMEALADGICDALLLVVYEKRMRTDETFHQPWVDRQWEKAMRGLDYLNANPPKLPKQITVGQIAVRSMISYLDLRFAGKWEKGRGKLKRWAARFDEKWPELGPELSKG